MMKRFLRWWLNKNEIAGATSLLSQILLELRVIRTELTIARTRAEARADGEDATLREYRPLEEALTVHDLMRQAAGPLRPLQPIGK